jgi:superfamily I DNA/RNA helicase
MTLHAAKGLEFEEVFLVGVQEERLTLCQIGQEALGIT